MEFKLPPVQAEAVASDPMMLLLIGLTALGSLVFVLGARTEIVTAALVAGIVGVVFAS